MIRCGQSATNMYDDNHHPLTIYTTCMMKVFRTALEAVTRRLSGQPRSRNKDYDYDDTTTTPNMTKDEVNALGFHKLRSACSRHGLPATGKACELRKRLLDLIPSAVVAVSEPIIDTIATVSMTLDDVNSLTYNQLRSACARHGLPATGKDLISRQSLRDFICAKKTKVSVSTSSPPCFAIHNSPMPLQP